MGTNTLPKQHRDDQHRCIQCCAEISERILNNVNLLFFMCCSDGCLFYLHWCDLNAAIMRKQYWENLNAWAGIWGNNTVGPVFLLNNLTRESFLNLIHDFINSHIVAKQTKNVQILENNVFKRSTYLHTMQFLYDFLNQHFSWLLISSKCCMIPRSPYLTQLKFFFWYHLKSVIYKTQPTSLNDVSDRIVVVNGEITPKFLGKISNKHDIIVWRQTGRNLKN